jgi:hypothetical protein
MVMVALANTAPVAAVPDTVKLVGAGGAAAEATSLLLLPQALNTPSSNRLAVIFETIEKFISFSHFCGYRLDTFGGALVRFL